MDNTEAAVLQLRVEKLTEALTDAEAALALCEKPSLADPYIIVALRELGDRHGYGNVMSSASELWRQKLTDQGLAGGEFVAGPCRTTVVQVLERVRAALSDAKTKEAGE